MPTRIALQIVRKIVNVILSTGSPANREEARLQLLASKIQMLLNEADINEN